MDSLNPQTTFPRARRSEALLPLLLTPRTKRGRKEGRKEERKKGSKGGRKERRKKGRKERTN